MGNPCDHYPRPLFGELGWSIFLLLSIPWLFLRAEFYTLHNSIIPLEESTYNALMFLLLGMLKLFVMYS